MQKDAPHIWQADIHHSWQHGSEKGGRWHICSFQGLYFLSLICTTAIMKMSARTQTNKSAGFFTGCKRHEATCKCPGDCICSKKSRSGMCIFSPHGHSNWYAFLQMQNPYMLQLCVRCSRMLFHRQSREEGLCEAGCSSVKNAGLDEIGKTGDKDR